MWAKIVFSSWPTERGERWPSIHKFPGTPLEHCRDETVAGIIISERWRGSELDVPRGEQLWVTTLRKSLRLLVESMSAGQDGSTITSHSFGDLVATVGLNIWEGPEWTTLHWKWERNIGNPVLEAGTIGKNKVLCFRNSARLDRQTCCWAWGAFARPHPKGVGSLGVAKRMASG